MRFYEPRIAPRKRALLASLRGRVLEIGPGTGPNLKYFTRHVEWTGVEPNPHMHRYLRREAERLGMNVTLVEGSAMDLPFEDGSFDAVVGTLVLCSVPDPDRVLAEVKRVLKPGGTYRFVEHVQAEPGSRTARVQRFIKPIWHCCADGCHVDRRSWEPIERAGFGDVAMERFQLPFPIVSPHIVGQAVVG